MELLEYLGRLAVAFGLGCAIGMERQFTNHSIGIKTCVLVCVGSCLFTLFPLCVPGSDVVRMAAQIVTGVGFLGSGIIFKDGANVRGVNTAATIWCTAAIGILSGAGLHLYAVIATVCLTVVNVALRFASNRLEYLRESRSLNGSNRQPYLCEVTKCHFVEFSGCTLDANGITYDSVYARSSHVFLYNCGLYNALQGLECYLAQGNMKDCCGSCSWAMVSYASLVIASGTVPAGSRGTGENGLLYASSVTTDYGTAIPTVTPDETGILYATTTKSWRGSWRTDTLDVIQGVYYDSGYNSSLNWNRGCMWFSNAQNLLWGCTVKSATLTLHRKTGSGSSSAKSVYLCAITNTSASGTPSIAKNYGAIGTIGRDKQVTFSIPVDAVQGLADGYYGGLCLYETPYNFGSSTYSNAYMRMSGTDTNYEPYIECVFSGSTAVG